jgi:hypothetical protein
MLKSMVNLPDELVGRKRQQDHSCGCPEVVHLNPSGSAAGAEKPEGGPQVPRILYAVDLDELVLGRFGLFLLGYEKFRQKYDSKGCNGHSYSL